MVVFALKDNNRFSFSCVSDTDKEFNVKVNRAFYIWKAMQQQGSNKTVEDFLSGFTKVKLTVEAF